MEFGKSLVAAIHRVKCNISIDCDTLLKVIDRDVQDDNDKNTNSTYPQKMNVTQDASTNYKQFVNDNIKNIDFYSGHSGKNLILTLSSSHKNYNASTNTDNCITVTQDTSINTSNRVDKVSGSYYELVF